MKKLLILSLVLLLSGCIKYYQPETALEDGIYYPEDDPSYAFNSSDYSGVIVYPWSSLDYFYFGYGGYYGHYFAYGYPYYWGFPPYGYPYGYYDYRSARYPGSYYHAYRVHCPGCRHHRYGNRNDKDERDLGHDGDDQGGDNQDVADSLLVRRYVTTAPGTYNDNRGMVVRNNASTKIGGSHQIEPGKSSSSKTGSVSRSTSSPAVRSSHNRSSGSVSRSRARSYSSPRASSSKSVRRRDRD